VLGIARIGYGIMNVNSSQRNSTSLHWKRVLGAARIDSEKGLAFFILVVELWYNVKFTPLHWS